MNQTLMFLGGGVHQTPAIKKAKEMGVRTVLCDYDFNCPGKSAADAFYNVSTNDYSALLKIAELENIDGVLAYTADSAAHTVAKLAQSLQLPGYHPPEAVEKLIHKDLLRSFLREHGFAVPHSKSFQHTDFFLPETADEYEFPVIVKPVDASGSKGVEVVHHPDRVNTAIQKALSFSRSKRVLVEEYIDAKAHQICGVGYLQEGRIVVHHASDQYFDEDAPNPDVPVSSTFSLQEEHAPIEERIVRELQKLFSLLGMGNGSFVYEIRIGRNNEIYFLDISPRNSGDYLDQLVALAYGNDLMEASILAALGRPFQPSNQDVSDNYWAHYCIHSKRPGILSKVEIFPIEGQVLEEVYYHYKDGDAIYPPVSAADFIGVALMSFKTKEAMYAAVQSPEDWHSIRLKEVRQNDSEKILYQQPVFLSASD